MKNLKRLKNILTWIATGRFDKLFRAILDQVRIRSSAVRKHLRRINLFEKQRQKIRLRELLAEYYGVHTGSKKGLKVALILRDGTHYPKSSAFIRLISPLTNPALRSKVSIKLYAENAVAVEDDTDICIVQRTAFDNEKAATRLVKSLHAKGASLIFDNDDAFHEIDTNHPEHSLQAARLIAMNRIVRAADQIWLSVPALVSSYSSVKGKVSVIQNSLDERIWSRRASFKAKPNNGPIRMVYMGTATHDADLEMILPALEEVAQLYPGSFKLTFIGVAEHLPQKDWIERIYQPKYGSIYPNFVKWFRKQGPFDVGLSPLVDSEFNQGKSDIKCLDYLAAGIRPVVSDILPYRSSGTRKFNIVVKNEQRDWVRALSRIVENPESFRRQSVRVIAGGQKYIWSKRSSSLVAHQMFKLIGKAKTIPRS